MTYEEMRDYCRAMLQEGEDGEVILPADKVMRMFEAMEGWRGSAWKDGKYVDDIQAYFDRLTDQADAAKE